MTTTGRAASSTNPQTWATYDAARNADHGFMLGGGFACIDVDHCFNSRGQLFGWAKAIVEAAEGAWIERSISGDGLHIFGLAFEAPGHHYGRVEVYSTARFIRTTANIYQPGELIPLAKTIETISNLHRAGTIPPRPVKGAA